MTAPDPDPMPSARWCDRFLCVWLLVRTLLWLVAVGASHPNGPLALRAQNHLKASVAADERL